MLSTIKSSYSCVGLMFGVTTGKFPRYTRLAIAKVAMKSRQDLLTTAVVKLRGERRSRERQKVGGPNIEG